MSVTSYPSTLDGLRSAWHDTAHHHKGGVCPVCDRWGRAYTRSLNKSMHKALEWLASASAGLDIREYVCVPENATKDVLRTNQLASCRWWGLVEAAPAKTGKRGRWRLTLKGREFVAGTTSVQEKVVVYNGAAIKYLGDTISFNPK